MRDGHTGRRLTGILATVMALTLLAPAAAQAISVSGTAAPTNLKAGSHSDFKVHISLGGSVKNLIIGLPPGEVGDPNAAPFCSVSQLNADSCPANTKVGAASTIVNLLGLLPNPLPVTGNIYNLAPHTGEPARFGIALHALALLGAQQPDPAAGDPPVGGPGPPDGLRSRHRRQGHPQLRHPARTGRSERASPIAINTMDLSLFGVAPGTGKPS